MQTTNLTIMCGDDAIHKHYIGSVQLSAKIVICVANFRKIT